MTFSRRGTLAGLSLYFLAPYRRFLFDYMASLPNVRTIMDFEIDGMTELEILLTDMSLAAACELFVRDPISSLSDMIEGMRWGYSVADPNQVVQEDELGNRYV